MHLSGVVLVWCRTSQVNWVFENLSIYDDLIENIFQLYIFRSAIIVFQIKTENEKLKSRSRRSNIFQKN